LIALNDEERLHMEPPVQIVPKDLADYFDVMSKAVFQAGIAWTVINNKWAGTREALHNFKPEAIAGFGPPEIDLLMTDTRVVRNRKKLEALVHNANELLRLDKEHGSFKAYLESHADFETTVKDLRKRFKFLGEFGCFYFLYVVGQPVPEYEAWRASRAK
jgi:DNA-3-methyladenine glycosylase I